MRASILASMLVLLAAGAASQPGPEGAQVSYDDAERVVRTALQHLSEGVYTGSEDKGLSRLGDASSVALTKVYGGQDLTTDDIRHILLVVRFSFAAPRIVEVPSDRRPRTTMFLLKYLDRLAADPELKRQIAETKTSTEQAAKLAQ